MREIYLCFQMQDSSFILHRSAILMHDYMSIMHKSKSVERSILKYAKAVHAAMFLLWLCTVDIESYRLVRKDYCLSSLTFHKHILILSSRLDNLSTQLHRTSVHMIKSFTMIKKAILSSILLSSLVSARVHFVNKRNYLEKTYEKTVVLCFYSS